ncbi:MAG: hypothetical protein ABEH81_14040 [Halopenitus sp.]
MDFGDFDRDEFASLFGEDELDVDQQIEQLRECVEKRDRRTLLEKIAIGTYISGNAAALEIRDDMVGLPPALAEFVVGHIIVADDIDDKNPSYKMLSRAANNVAEAYQYSGILDENPDEWTDEERYQHEVENALVLREIAAGRHYYWDQPIEAARRAFQPHDQMMRDLLGFTIDEAIDFQKHVEGILNALLQKAMEPVENANVNLYSDIDSLDALQEFLEDEGRPPRFSELAEHRGDISRIEKIHDLMGDRTDYLWVPESTLVKHLPEDLNEDSFRAFLDRFSVELGDWDHPMGPDFWSIDDLNPLHIQPYIRYEGEILVPHISVPRRALMTTFYYDLIQTESYEGEFGNRWGDYIENWAYESLEGLFDTAHVLLNPTYETSNGDINEFTDIVVDSGDSVFIIECKAAKLNLDTRSGDFSAVKRDLEDGVGKAASQLEDSLSKIRSSTDTIEIETENKSLTYGQGDSPDLIPMVVLGEQYDAISTNFYDLATDEVQFTPYVVNVMNLDIICEALTNTRHFRDYVNARVNQVRNNKFLSVDEIDYLGLFIDGSVGFPELSSNHHTQLRDYSHQVRQAIGNKYGP